MLARRIKEELSGITLVEQSKLLKNMFFFKKSWYHPDNVFNNIDSFTS